MSRPQDPDPSHPGEQVLRLLLMRHAKAAWPDDVSDHERPLSPRGRGDAASMGRWLAGSGWAPDHVVASDARRTLQTGELLVETLGGQIEVTADPDLYECGISDVLERINATTPQVGTLLIVGHEPTMSATTAVITGRRVRFCTGAIAQIELDVAWAAVQGETGDLIGVHTPKD